MRAAGLPATLALVAALALSGCGGSDEAADPAPPAQPPAAEPSPPPAEPPPAEQPAETQPPAETEPGSDAELPAAVAETRDAILAAARARDYDGLEALLDPATFSYSFGEDGDPIGYWRNLEKEGHVPVLGDILPIVLGTPFAKQDDIYVWPSAAAKEAPDWTEDDLESMRALYTDEEIESMRETLGGYLGWRVGIREDGTWLYFVAGD
jgi:hypothetical protein